MLVCFSAVPFTRNQPNVQQEYCNLLLRSGRFLIQSPPMQNSGHRLRRTRARLVWKLAQSPHVTRLWCAPGNAGIAQERLREERRPRPVRQPRRRRLARPAGLRPGEPRRPHRRRAGQPAGARHRGFVPASTACASGGRTSKPPSSKPPRCSRSSSWRNTASPPRAPARLPMSAAASRFAASLGGRCAVKADGLALGKGVLICRDMAQADHAIEEVLVRKSFGARRRQHRHPGTARRHGNLPPRPLRRPDGQALSQPPRTTSARWTATAA